MPMSPVISTSRPVSSRTSRTAVWVMFFPDVLHPSREGPVPAVSPAHQQHPTTVVADERAGPGRYRVRRRGVRIMPVVAAAHGCTGLTVAHTSSNCAASLTEGGGVGVPEGALVLGAEGGPGDRAALVARAQRHQPVAGVGRPERLAGCRRGAE